MERRLRTLAIVAAAIIGSTLAVGYTLPPSSFEAETPVGRVRVLDIPPELAFALGAIAIIVLGVVMLFQNNADSGGPSEKRGEGPPLGGA